MNSLLTARSTDSMLVKTLSRKFISFNSSLIVLPRKVDRYFFIPPIQTFLKWFQQSTSKMRMSSESYLRKASAASWTCSEIRRRIFLAPLHVFDVKLTPLPKLPIFIEIRYGILCWYEGCEYSNTSAHHCNRLTQPAMVDSTSTNCYSDVSPFSMTEVESMRRNRYSS